MAPRLVYAVRHGESLWNVQRRQYPSDEGRYRSELYLPDCSITELGVRQSRDAGAKLNDLLLTAARPATTSQDRPDEDSSADSSSSSSTLLVVSPLRRAIQTANEMMASGWSHHPRTVMMVQPLAAEIVTDSCDIGTPASDLQREFPSYDFTNVPEYWWWPYGQSPDETYRRLAGENSEGGGEGAEPESHIFRTHREIARLFACGG
jgi:broad specificity phosphatase PhoE